MRFVNALLLIFMTAPLYAAEFSLEVFNTKLGLTGQAGWTPEKFEFQDSFRGVLLPSQATLNGVIQLEKAIPAGRTHIFVKGYADEGIQLKVMASAGGASSAFVNINNNDGSKLWTTALSIDIPQATDVLTLTLGKQTAYSSAVGYVLRGVYITQNLNEIVDGNGLIMDPTLVESLIGTPPVPGNILSNSSFEVPLDAGWGYKVETHKEHSTLRTNETSFHGNNSLVLSDNWTHAVSRAYHLKAGKTYTFSAYIKASTSEPIYGDLLIENVFDPSGDDPPYTLKQSFVTTNQWTRISVMGSAMPSPSSHSYLKIVRRGGGSGKLYADAIQLEEGAQSAYGPSHPLEIGITFDPKGHIFHRGVDTIQAKLHLYNNNSTNANDSLTYSVFNASNRVIKVGSLQPTWTSRQTVVVPIPVDGVGSEYGYFRVVVHGKKDRWAERERAFSIIYPVDKTPNDAASVMGIHTWVDDFHLILMNRLGIKWIRSMSVDPLVKWNGVESANDQWIWNKPEGAAVQSKIDLLKSYGIMILGTLYGDPAWAVSGAQPNLSHWSDYVRNTVSHYQDKIKYWEIGNEPIQEAGITVTNYAQMLKSASDIIKSINAANPLAGLRTVGMGGFPYPSTTWGGPSFRLIIDEVKRLFPTWNWAADIKIHSTHIYHMNPGSYKKTYDEIINPPSTSDIPKGLEIWNTETGSWSQFAYQGEETGFFLPLKTLVPYASANRIYDSLKTSPREMASNFINTVGWGQKKYFYYDMRDHTAPDFESTHCTILEYDGHIRPTGVAYAIAGHFLDHAERLDSLFVKTNAPAHFFRKNGKLILALARTDAVNESLSMSLLKGSPKVYDMMGNLIATSLSSIPFGPEPVYITVDEWSSSVPSGATLQELKTAAANGTVGRAVDTLAPTITIIEAPVDAVDENFFRVRWVALDNVSVPVESSPQALMYRYRLVNKHDWTPWTEKALETYVGVPKGTYRFEVMAKDEAGNISATAARDIEVQDVFNSGSNPPQPPPPSITYHPADTDKNLTMSLNEVTQYGYCWRSAPAIPAGCPTGSNMATMESAVRAGSLWNESVTGSYRYNSGLSCPSCWEAQ